MQSVWLLREEHTTAGSEVLAIFSARPARDTVRAIIADLSMYWPKDRAAHCTYVVAERWLRDPTQTRAQWDFACSVAPMPEVCIVEPVAPDEVAPSR